MSKLIDAFVIDNYNGVKTENKCKRISDEKIIWVLAKPLNKTSLKNRFKDAWRIITNKSFAVHYFEDDVDFDKTFKE